MPPLYLLLDTALVGHLGATQLAALAAATTIQAIVTTQLTFLSYGTTARASREYGAGNLAGAVAEGIQATWLAILIGMVLMLIMWLGAPTFTLFVSHDPQVAQYATGWLRLCAPLIPATLLTMAGNGWMRAVQRTQAPLIYTAAGLVPGVLLLPVLVRSFGLSGSAIANVIGASITAALFAGTLIRAQLQLQLSWRWNFQMMRAQLSFGRDLVLRSASFQVAMLLAATLAGRVSSHALAGHQVLVQLWNFLAMVLDSFAIAAQTLVGAALGAGQIRKARQVGSAVMAYSCAYCVLLMLGLWLVIRPDWFTNDAATIAVLQKPWLVLIFMLPLGAIVFAIDGVVIGAGDRQFLRWVTVIGVTVGFLPLAALAAHFNWGLTGIWLAEACFLSVRLLLGLWRFYSLKWARTGSSAQL